MSPAQEGAINKGIVVHVQQTGYLLFRLCLGVGGDGDEAQTAVYEQVQAALAGGAAALGPGMLADDAIEFAVVTELKLHLHVALALVNKVVVAFGARLAPQRPGDGVNYGRLAGAVFAGDAGGVDPANASSGVSPR
jgi:hypothetical protein